MKVILNCTNLIGDSIYLLNPVQMFLEQFPDQCVAIVADKGFAFEMFFNSFSFFGPLLFDEFKEATDMFPEAQVLNLNAGSASQLCTPSGNRENRQLHISEGYAQMLGVKLNTIVPTTAWQRVDDSERLTPEYILISPFSRSCSVHTTGKANKTLDDWKWEHIIRSLRTQGYVVKVLAGPNDYLKKCSVPVDDYITCKNLYHLELVLKSAKLFVTLDNGVGHVAAALNLPMIYLWPIVSNIDFIYPKWNAKAKALIMNPLETAPVALFVSFRKVVRELLELPDEEVETPQT